MEQLLKLAEMFYKEATEKRYWGVKCSGALFVCRDDGTVFLAKRSSKVEKGGTWGIPGGAVDIFQDELEAKMDEVKGFPGFWYFPDLDDDKYPDPPIEVFEESALRETEEECGLVPEIAARLQIIDFKDKEFTYKTFVFNLSKEAKSQFTGSLQVNWETSKFKWFPINKLPGNIHAGLQFALNHVKV